MKTQKIFLLTTLVLLVYLLNSQVGINTNDPDQTLDVNGKIKVGNDGTTPTEGTMRYSSTGDFEGYTAEGWQSFTESSHLVGENVNYVQVYDFGAPADGVWAFPDQSGTYGDNGAYTGQALPVPSGKILVVDQICVTNISSGENNYFYAGVARATAGGANYNPQIYITGGSASGNTCLQANKAPILVIPEGNTIRVYNSTSSTGSVRMIITGVLVNSMQEYWEL